MKKVIVFLGALLIGASLVPLVSLAGGSFYVDGSTGYVGVGNTTPVSPLDVSGAMYSRLVTASSTAIDWNAGNVQEMTLSSSPTLTFSNGQAGGKYDLILNQDGMGGRTVTWPASVKWENAMLPILTNTPNATDIASFIYDGTNYLGSFKTSFATSSPPSIAFDSVSNGVSGNPLSSLSWTHTTSGSNRILFVCAMTDPDGDVSGATYNGVSMTQVATINAGGFKQYLFALANPSLGANTVVVSRSGSAHGMYGTSISYTGALQTSTVDTSTTNSASGSGNLTTGITTSVSDDWGIICGWNLDSAVSGSVIRTTYSTGIPTIFDSNAPYTSAGSHSMTVHAGAAAGLIMAGFAGIN